MEHKEGGAVTNSNLPSDPHLPGLGHYAAWGIKSAKPFLGEGMSLAQSEQPENDHHLVQWHSLCKQEMNNS